MTDSPAFLPLHVVKEINGEVVERYPREVPLRQGHVIYAIASI